MENRAVKPMIQGDGLSVGQPVAPPAAARHGEQPVNNPYFADQGKTTSAPTTTTPLIPDTLQPDRILYEATSPNLMSANFDMVHGDDFDGPPPANLPPASPPALRPSVDILTRAHNAQAQYATFSFVGGNRYRNSNNQTRNPPNSNTNGN